VLVQQEDDVSASTARFELDHSPHEVVIHAVGEVDLDSTVDFEACVLEVVDSDRTLVFDLSGVTFLDSSGLGVMAHAARRRGTVGPIAVRGASDSVQRILDISGLSSLFGSDSSDRSEV
jgi:anti-anti-sigma factor